MFCLAAFWATFSSCQCQLVVAGREMDAHQQTVKMERGQSQEILVLEMGGTNSRIRGTQGDNVDGRREIVRSGEGNMEVKSESTLPIGSEVSVWYWIICPVFPSCCFVSGPQGCIAQ